MDLVVGATGRLGGVIARRLLRQGRRVRVLTREVTRAAELVAVGADVALGDLRDPASLARACRGVERVVASAHGFEAADAAAVDAGGNRNLVDAARREGVRRHVMVSVVGASPRSPIDVFHAKADAEAYLAASGLEYAIVRATAFMEFWAALIGRPVLQGRSPPVFGRGDNPINFVSVEDVAEFVLLALEDPRALGRVLEVGGPEDLTLEQVVATFEAAAGRRVGRRHVPVPVLRVLSVALRRVRPVVARRLAAGAFMATADLRLDPREALALRPVPLTRLVDVATAMARGPAHASAGLRPG